jgi:hypothetical protein
MNMNMNYTPATLRFAKKNKNLVGSGILTSVICVTLTNKNLGSVSYFGFILFKHPG